MSTPKIYIPEFDYHRIQRSLGYEINDDLLRELERAEIISDVVVPPDLVTLDTIVRYRLDDEEEVRETMVVLPACPQGQDMVVSVHDELGSALLGLRVGESIQWKVGDHLRTLTVLDIKYQPESSGDGLPMVFHVEGAKLSNLQ